MTDGARHAPSSNPSRNAFAHPNQPNPTAAARGGVDARPHITPLQFRQLKTTRCRQAELSGLGSSTE